MTYVAIYKYLRMCTFTLSDRCIISYTTLTKYAALPMITRHPNNDGNITTAEGSNVMLRCTATGNGTLNYQWRRVSGSLPSSTKVKNNGETLVIRRMAVSDSGQYYCEVDNGGDSVSSMRVQVTARSELISMIINSVMFN